MERHRNEFDFILNIVYQMREQPRLRLNLRSNGFDSLSYIKAPCSRFKYDHPSIDQITLCVRILHFNKRILKWITQNHHDIILLRRRRLNM